MFFGLDFLGCMKPRFKRCALLTCTSLNEFSFTDRVLSSYFAERGWVAEFLPWDQTALAWSDFDAVVVRATWDYTRRLSEFLSTLEKIDSAGIRLLNPLSTIRWNACKTYLLDLQGLGVPMIPTLIRNLENVDFKNVWRHFGVDEVVVKPLVSANAHRTFRIKKEALPLLTEELEKAFVQAHGSRVVYEDFMVQPFLNSVCSEGETSLFFFGGQYSHSVRKVPKPGDFRVQEEHGADVQAVVPSAELLRVAAATISAIPVEHLYARLDFVLGANSQWLLMEAELIEPSLYLSKAPQAARNFVDAFLEFQNL